MNNLFSKYKIKIILLFCFFSFSIFSNFVFAEGNYALSFDGVNNYMITPNLASYFETDEVTFSVWFKANAEGVIVSELGQNTPNTGWHDSQIEILSSGEVKIRVWSLNPVSLGMVSFETWHNVTLRYNTVTNILDGFLDGEEAVSNILGDRSAPFENGYSQIYALGVADGTNLGSGLYFNGLIDEFVVWNRSLSNSEIITLYNNGSGLYGDKSVTPFNSGLVAGYHFDEGSGFTVTDFSDNGNNGTVNGDINYVSGFVVYNPPSIISKMFSVNYIMDNDSINFGGMDYSVSESGRYVLLDTIGEIGTGNSSSISYSISAGYRSFSSSYISISAANDVSLPSMSGLISGESNSQESWLVKTDNSAGYEILVKASTSPALKTIDGSYFNDYAPSVSNTPDYMFSVGSTDSTFAFSPEGQDISQKYLDDGFVCGAGNYDTQDRCWDGFSTTGKVIAYRSSSNHPDGTVTNIKYKTAIGSNKIQDAGNYTSVIIVTAVAL